MLFQVMFPDECSVTEVTLELLCASVDEHVRRHVGFLGERLLANCASIVLLTCWQKNKETISKIIFLDGCLCAELNRICIYTLKQIGKQHFSS